jgi:class 3 adenylate cyclase
MMARPAQILIVDDEPFNIDYLEQELDDLDCKTSSAQNGRAALAQVADEAPDLILLDIMMPEMDGFQVLEHLKVNKAWRDIPVIVISALDDLENIARGIRMGADDYLPKPFDPVILKARIEASLERKRWHDQEQEYLAIIKSEREKSERLLLHMLPAPIAERLKQGETVIADSFAEVTILFSDIVDFTPLTTQMTPDRLVMLLNDLFSALDQLVRQFGLEKIRAIGDEFIVAAGVPSPRPDHAEAVADFALAMRGRLAQFNAAHNSLLGMRIGIDTGPVIAGVIGTTKFSYDLWGDAMNTASRMQSHGIPDRIQVTAATYEQLRNKYQLEERGLIDVKGRGEMRTYFLNGKLAIW